MNRRFMVSSVIFWALMVVVVVMLSVVMSVTVTAALAVSVIPVFRAMSSMLW